MASVTCQATCEGFISSQVNTLIRTLVYTHNHLRGLKCRGSERSRGGRGSRLRATLESSSVGPDGF